MVRSMLVLLFMLLPASAYCNAGLSLQLEQDTQQLGRAFNARLIASDIDNKLSTIDLSALRKDFGIIIKEYSADTGKANKIPRQQLLLELYPRHSGFLHIPELSFESAVSAPIDVEVSTAQGASGPIQVEYEVSTSNPWQRQQVLVNVKVTSPDKFSHLSSEDMPYKDGETLQIPATKELHDGAAQLKVGWVVFPLRAGLQTLSLPSVFYHLQGGIERRFFLPDIQLNIKPLPGYIPPLMPVGRVTIDSSIDSNRFLTTGETYHWNVRLESPDLLSHLLPPILRQINSDKNIHFLSAQSQRQQNISGQGSHGEVIHSIPFQSLTTGSLVLPALRIQYFDPELGRVSVADYSPPQRWSVALHWQLLAVVLSLLALSFIMRSFWKYWSRQRHRYLFIKEARQHLISARNNNDLREAMRLIARAERWPENTSIATWAELWNQDYSPSATTVSEDLSRTCYSPMKTDIEDIRQNLLTLITRRRPTRHRLHTIFY